MSTIIDTNKTILPVTEFRKNMKEILENLTAPRLLLKNDKPQAVLVPVEHYIELKKALEEKEEKEFVAEIKRRLTDGKYLTEEEFFAQLQEEMKNNSHSE